MVRVAFADEADAEDGGLVEPPALMVVELVTADALELVAVGVERIVEGGRQEELHRGQGWVRLGEIAHVRRYVVPEALSLGEHGCRGGSSEPGSGSLVATASTADSSFAFVAGAACFFVVAEAFSLPVSGSLAAPELLD